MVPLAFLHAVALRLLDESPLRNRLLPDRVQHERDHGRKERERQEKPGRDVRRGLEIVAHVLNKSEDDGSNQNSQWFLPPQIDNDQRDPAPAGGHIGDEGAERERQHRTSQCAGESRDE